MLRRISRHHDRIGPRLVEPPLGLGLASEVDFFAADGQDFAVGGGKTAHDGCANHAAMAGYPDALSRKVKNLRIHGVPARGGGM